MHQRNKFLIGVGLLAFQLALLPISAQQVSFNTGKTRLKQIFDRIEQSTKYKFEYNSMFNVNRTVYLKQKKADALSIVSEVLKGTGYTYSLRGNYIVISRANTVQQQSETKPSEYTVKGTLTDAKGDPIIGASIFEKGTHNGTVTDVNGHYVLRVNNASSTLVVTYVGYETKELKASTANTTIILNDDNKSLDEVVVVGYGSVKKSNLTYSVSKIVSDNIEDRPLSTLSEAFQGQLAGVRAQAQNGVPGQELTIRIRGMNSINGDSSPLYVIDGVPRDNMSDLNSSDVASIQVLKDAAATSIYGSRGANGVILIETKQGKGKPTVNFDAYYGFNQPEKKLKLMNGYEWVAWNIFRRNEDYLVRGGNMSDPMSMRPASDRIPDNWLTANIFVDWQDEVLRTGVSHNHNVAINGGNSKTKYMASINYMNRQGVIDGTHMYRANVRSLISTKVLKDRLELSVGMNSMYGKHVGVSTGVDGASVLDAMNYYNPMNPIKGNDGNWFLASGSANYNPLSMINEDTSETIWKRNQVVAKGSLKIIDGLTWNNNYSFDNYQSTYSDYHSHNTQLVPYNAYNGNASRNTYHGKSQTFESYVNYDVTLAKVHKLALMAGYSWEERESGDGFGLSVHNFFDDYLKWNQLTYAGTIDGMSAVQSGTKETVRNISFYGRASYSYNSKYMLQATIRRDGSSVFADGHRWGTFPSVSAAWNITEEQFMKNQDVFDNLKLRLGYGVSGNALGFGAYSGVATYGSTGITFPYQGNSWVILAATKLANYDLTWETTGMFNVGIDYGFWKNRINGSIEFYNKKTKDLIWNYPVSTVIYPIDNIAANVGEITNTGIEFTINIDAIRTKDFNWMTTINLSHNKNKVNKLSNDKYQTSTFAQGDPRVAGVSANGYTQRVMEGQPLGTFYLYEFAGYEDVVVDGKTVTWPTYYVRDENGNKTGETTSSPEYKDRYVAGNAQPKLNFGWNNTFSYKNWSATLFFTGVIGNKIYNGSRAHYTSRDFFDGGKNVLKEFITDRPATDNLSNIPSDRFLEKGDYLRLQTLTLGYTFDKLNNWMQSLQVYATCNNVFTLTSYKGLDPEVNMGGIDPGVDYRWSTYPHTRTIMVGVRANF